MFAPTADGAAQDYLTKRDSWSKGMGWLFEGRQSPRTDCPSTVPDVPSHRLQFPGSLPPLDGKMKISDLQAELLQLAAAACEEGRSEADAEWVRAPEALGRMSEREGLAFVVRRMTECGIDVGEELRGVTAE
jgi:hypothetical protein